MAVNHNRTLSNQASMFLGATGSGKSVAVTYFLEQSIKKSTGPARVLLWDPDRDHKASKHFTSFAEYVRSVRAAIKSKKPYRLAFSGDRKHFGDWCQLAWAALDGDYTVHLLTEELAGVTTASHAPEFFETLNMQARKYGGRLVMVSQRPQKVTKTAYTQAAMTIVAKVKGNDAKYIANSLGANEAMIRDIPPPEKDTPKKDFVTLHYVAIPDTGEEGQPFKLILNTKTGSIKYQEK